MTTKSRKYFIGVSLIVVGYFAWVRFTFQPSEISSGDGEIFTAIPSRDPPSSKDVSQNRDSTAGQGTNQVHGDRSHLPADANERMGLPITDAMRSTKVTWKDLKAGSGKQIKEGSQVSFHIVMQLRDGRVVFHSQKDGRAWTGKIGDGSILAGLDQTLRGMFEGQRRVMWIPPHLAYGKYGIHPQVPPESWVYADVTILTVY